MGAYIAYYEIFIGPYGAKDYPNVAKYMLAIKDRPAFAETIGTEYGH